MQEFINNDTVNILYNSQKQRLYSTFTGFMKGAAEQQQLAMDLISQLYYQIPEQITAVVDIRQLRIMEPQTAEYILCQFLRFMRVKRTQAVAVVRNPENVLIKMQLQRVLGKLQQPQNIGAREFTYQTDADFWLDRIRKC